MLLKDLLRDVATLSIKGAENVAVAQVRDDSRQVAPGDLFVALPGQKTDGHAFVSAAAARGAVVIVTERDVPFVGTQVRVASCNRALAQIAANYYGRPAEALRLVGVTGTNGKTTTAHLVESMLLSEGHKPGLLGTVGYRMNDITTPAPLTTPSALDLQRLFGQMRDAGCDHVVMEVSSHALAQERVGGLLFDVAIFTNLTRDHLDFHGSMEAYFEAKSRLFSQHLKGTAILRVDTEEGQRMSRVAKGRILGCSSQPGFSADVVVQHYRSSLNGIEATVNTPAGPVSLESRLVGEYNLENLLCAVGAGTALDLSTAAIRQGIAALVGVPGRLEQVETSRGFHVLVDYAHTPDALRRAMAAVKPLTNGRLLVVFGCGGDRDRSKRPLMGEAVAKAADLVIVTSDNPRTENARTIIDEILPGVRRAGAQELAVEVDRRCAIRLALKKARKGDTVLIAGKGHEDYQILGTEKIHFDDREEVRKALEELS